jgi:hypothetical protein
MHATSIHPVSASSELGKCYIVRKIIETALSFLSTLSSVYTSHQVSCQETTSHVAGGRAGQVICAAT